MQIKTTMRYQFTLTRMAIIKKTNKITKKEETGPSYIGVLTYLITSGTGKSIKTESGLAVTQTQRDGERGCYQVWAGGSLP